MAITASRRVGYLDVITGGPATISGTVRILTVTASRPVYLLVQEGLSVRRATQSAANGAYSFTGLAEGTEWMVLTIDPNGAYNAVVADRIMT